MGLYRSTTSCVDRGVDTPVSIETTGSGELGYFYFNGTSSGSTAQFATIGNGGTKQSVIGWEFRARFIMPPSGTQRYIAESAGRTSLFITDDNRIRCEYVGATGDGSVQTSTNFAPVGSYLYTRVVNLLGAVTLFINNGEIQTGAQAPSPTQARFTLLGKKSGTNGKNFLGKIFLFETGNSTTGTFVADNSYTFNEGTGATFFNTGANPDGDAVITNPTAAGGGWDY